MPSRHTALWTVPLLISLAAWNRWFLFRIDRATAAETVERCMKMILLPFEKDAGRYRLTLGSGPALLGLTTAPLLGVILTLRGNPKHKKVALLRALLAKSFRPVFPRLRIDLR